MKLLWHIAKESHNSINLVFVTSNCSLNHNVMKTLFARVSDFGWSKLKGRVHQHKEDTRLLGIRKLPISIWALLRRGTYIRIHMYVCTIVTHRCDIVTYMYV